MSEEVPDLPISLMQIAAAHALASGAYYNALLARIELA